MWFLYMYIFKKIYPKVNLAFNSDITEFFSYFEECLILRL